MEFEEKFFCGIIKLLTKTSEIKFINHPPGRKF